MNCEQRRDLMPLLLVEALEPADAAALRAHLAGGCTRCASYMAEADAVLNYLPYALDPVAPPAGARERLFERVREVAPAAPTPYASARGARGGSSRMPNWARRWMPAAVAACLVFVVTVRGMLSIQNAQEQALRRQLSDATRQVQDVNQVMLKTKQQNDQLSNEVQTAKVLYTSSKLITLEGRAQPKALGRAVWDAPRGSWHFRAFNMEPLKGKDVAYQLWFETPYGRKVGSLKTFVPDEHGDAHIVVTLPKDVGPVSAAFVTDEPSVGTYGPTGKVHLYGKLD